MKKQLKPLFTWRSAICESSLPPTTRHVLLTLSLYMNEMGESCFPSTATLARDTGLSERSVCTHLARAEECNWITKYVQGYKGRNWKQHGYKPTFPPECNSQFYPQGTEGGSVPQEQGIEGGSVPQAGATEPDDNEALKEVQWISSYDLSNNDVGECETVDKSESVDNSTSLASTEIKKFSMTLDWGPGEDFKSRCKLSGLNFDAGTMADAIGEFVSYWSTQKNRKYSQGEWEHRLVQRLKQADCNSLNSTSHHKNEDAIFSTGKRLGILPRPGELTEQYRQRVKKELERIECEKAAKAEQDEEFHKALIRQLGVERKPGEPLKEFRARTKQILLENQQLIHNQR